MKFLFDSLFLGELIILKETELKMIVLLNLSCFCLFCVCVVYVFRIQHKKREPHCKKNHVYKGEITDERL